MGVVACVAWCHVASWGCSQLWIFRAHLLPYSSLVKSVPTAPGLRPHLLQAFSFSLPPAVGGRRGLFAVSGNPKPGFVIAVSFDVSVMLSSPFRAVIAVTSLRLAQSGVLLRF